MKKYSFCKNNIFATNRFSIVPIRFQDRYDIMKWRNEQMYHLRQQMPLTIEDQDAYFSNVIESIFTIERPNQVLFSFLENDICIGYGGLVHINWIDRNAEISFIMDTKLEKKYFKDHWRTFLFLLEKLAFEDLNFHKIYTYAFNVRPKLFEILDECEYINEANLRNHVLINGVFENVLIHAKFNKLK